ncbi:hypothetical protein TD95_000865 [Thielaviopsis punctulata]|uniref:C2H2-type transcription factor MSN2 n=1 Tax=Thielaviopsis punctulata TaxID=72032 RepID=A0A0F4Z885_9PEZI|nr:hypothetical protein TD95_000865 [Thielaviopsis punctulata]
MESTSLNAMGQMSYFTLDHKQISMHPYTGMPITPTYPRPSSACSPQTVPPTLYSNAPAMPLLSKAMVMETPFCETPSTPLSMAGSVMGSPGNEMLINPLMCMDTTEWLHHLSPPHTPSGFMHSHASPSMTSCPSLSPPSQSPSPPHQELTHQFLDPRNLTVMSDSGSISSPEMPTSFDIIESEEFSKSPLDSSFEYLSNNASMPFELEPSEFDFDTLRMESGIESRRSRACTGSSIVSLSNGFFDDESFGGFLSSISETECENHRSKRVKTSSPSPVLSAALPSPPTSEPSSLRVSPEVEAQSCSSPMASAPSASETSCESTPVPAPTSRRGRKQSLTEDPSKTFVCDLCNRRFRRQEHLKRHYRSLHTQEKPFECNDCGKKFSRSDNLAQHARTHGSGAIVMDLIDEHDARLYSPMLAGVAAGQVQPQQDFSAYGKVLFTMPSEMASVQVDNGADKKKRKRSD